jgi:NADPH:quinone reductase-like Zn-dependent oxidoreductase
MITTDAWVLHAGAPAAGTDHPVRAELSREEFSFPEPDADEVLVEPLYGSWEGNVDHALARQPIDVCQARREDPIILGNGAVVRVLRPGADVTSCKEGNVCIVMPFGKRDRLGYAELVYGYDAPGTIGIMAKRTKLAGHMLLPLAENTAHSFAEWASYGRHFTAWDNWRAAYRCWMIQNEGSDPGNELVFAWGGGVAMAELLLAQRAGFRTAMTVSTDWRMANAASHGIIPVDRRRFPDLYFSERDAHQDAGYRSRYRAAEQQFTDVISELTGGDGAAIIIDNIGAPLYRAAMKVLSRRGVLATVGWKHGMRITNVRANACIQRHMYVNTHVWRYDDSPVIRDLHETTSLMSGVDPEWLYGFDAIPRLADDYAAARIRSYFPVFQVNRV